MGIIGSYVMWTLPLGGGNINWKCRNNMESKAQRYTAFMINTRKHSIWLRLFSGAPFAAAIMVVPFFAPRAQGQDQQPLNASDVADGMRLFQQKGNCQACHGLS